MNLTEETIRDMASDDYNYDNPLMKGRYCMVVNGFQYWFVKQSDGLWEFCNAAVTTWEEVLEIIHKSGVLIGEGRMLDKVHEKVRHLDNFHSRRSATWLRGKDESERDNSEADHRRDQTAC